MGVSAKNNVAIRSASYFGHAKVVKALLSSPSVDPSALRSEALQLAVEKGHFDVVKLLMEDDRVDPSVDGLAILVKAKKRSRNRSFNIADRKRYSELVSILQHDELVRSIQFLRRQKVITPTQFLEMIDSKRAWSHPSYIESVLKFPQVSELLSGILGIERDAAQKITTLEQLNEEMVQLMKSLEEDMDYRTQLSRKRKLSLQSLDTSVENTLSKKRWNFLWRYFGAHREYSEDNASRFNQLTVWKLQNVDALSEPPSKKPRLSR